MAIYHFAAKVISRADGSSAVASAAYRSASRLHDERLDRAHDFTNKSGVVHSEILAPKGAPQAWQDRAALWNAVEAGEKRKDAQLAREIEFALPREMDEAQGVALARDYVKREFVDRGMVADLNVHWDIAEDGGAKPHAHVMLTLRELVEGEGGDLRFGAKARDWNSTELLTHWREAWADHVNARLAQLGLEARIDHRSFADQGVELEPQDKIGPAGVRRLDRGESADRAQDHRDIARRNGARIIAEPAMALAAITHQQATFTDHDLARFGHRHSDGKDQFDRVMSALRTSPELVRLGRDGAGRTRFTSREMLDVERRLERSANVMAQRRQHGVRPSSLAAAVASSTGRGFVLSGEQKDAVEHVTGREDLALVVGYAGSGKSAMLAVAHEAWSAQGYRVRGAALSGIAAENLEAGSAIPSRTLASLERSWSQGRELLTARDVLVVDETGMIGSRQMQRVLDHAEKAGAKVVLVGDPQQLQAIEAGAAFRALAERHGAIEITQIRRQYDAWQQQATRHLATGRTHEALAAYASAGMVEAHDDNEAARRALIEGWSSERRGDPDKSRMILAYTREDVLALNGQARERMKQEALLGPDHRVTTPRGERAFATTDRVMFLRNERSLGVKNGTPGTIVSIGAGAMGVRLDDGRVVNLDLKTYADLDHGYAATIHKAQGVTVDRTHVLASGHMDRHSAYVALSRHRERTSLHFSRADFATRADLVRVLGRERPKDMALDYVEAFARRPQIGEREGPSRSASGMFAGFRPSPLPIATPSKAVTDDATRQAVRAYARATADASRMERSGLPVLEHQSQALARAGQSVANLWPGALGHLGAAMKARPDLLSAAIKGRLGPLLAAMETERTAGAGKGLKIHAKTPTLGKDREDHGWEI